MNLKGLTALVSLILIGLFFSCTKVNEATDIGGDLLPAVDNVHTFDTTLDAATAYHFFDDSTKSFINDYMALGKLNDPVFGSTNADMYFTLSSQTYKTYPFGLLKDSIKTIDSVVLSLGYIAAYGDTTNSQISVSVSEINPGVAFNDTVDYRFDQAAVPTTGPILGTKTFSTISLRDSVQIRRVGDTTTKVANVVRIRLNTSIADKLKQFDTTSSTSTGGYNNDSLFRTLFRGLAVKTTNVTGQGTLAYFNLYDAANSKLIVYYKVGRAGAVDSAASVSFVHSAYTQANSIIRNASGSYLANLNNPAPQSLYLQSSPSGSYIGIKIPKLDAFPNKVIHRAELIAYKLPSLSETFFTPPTRLLLDHKGKNNTSDSAYIFQNDLTLLSDGTSYNFAAFGGTLKNDNTYRFNITRYVQGIVTRKEANDSLRLYAPLRTKLNVKGTTTYISVPNLSFIANGRAVLAGGNYVDPSMRLRLHIIYSNL